MSREIPEHKPKAHWKRSIAISTLLIVLLLLVLTPGVWAQDYGFILDRNLSRVVVNRDGSADIESWLTFTCDPGAHPIDIADFGLPNKTYDLSTAQAWYSPGAGGGQEVPLTDIRTSTFLDIGVEVHLGQYTIQPGQQGTVHLKINVKEMVYPDSTDETYASVEYSPPYYVSDVVHGKTYMEIALYFPPGVTNEETRYHETQFTEVDRVDDRIVFIYTFPDAKGTDHPKVGISFPRTYVDKVYKAPIVIGGGGQGRGISDLLESFPQCGCFGGFILFFLVIVFLSGSQARKRKMAYMPPSLAVEGVGIKRGLTAAEAALLLERPLNRVLTMIMFGLLKKKAIAVTQEDPLRLEVIQPAPTEKLREYEQDFVDSIQQDGALDEKKLQKGIVSLVKSVNQKMKGFSRKETVAYYNSIVDRAWAQVTSETTPEVKSKYFDQGLEWMMMDEKFEERTTDTFREGPVYMPPWWAYYRPWVPRVRSIQASSGGGGGGRPSSGGGGGTQINLPTLPGAAFAGTLVSGMERTAGGIVSKLESFTSGITQQTNPMPVSSGSRGSSYRSGGCACACACACAGCACACAGGGR